MSDPPIDRDREGAGSEGNQTAGAPETPPEVSTGELMGRGRELLIRHGDELYRLRITRNGKLILQK